MKDLSDLHPDMLPLAARFLEFCAARSLTVKIYGTLRTHEEQARLYRQGRTLPVIKDGAQKLLRLLRPDLAQILMDGALADPPVGERIVTRALPGQSPHEYGLAFDAVPTLNGILLWDDSKPQIFKFWERMGAAGRRAGLIWGGDWDKFADMPHFQIPGFDWRLWIRKGTEQRG